jgi:hypothetical protein
MRGSRRRLPSVRRERRPPPPGIGRAGLGAGSSAGNRRRGHRRRRPPLFRPDRLPFRDGTAGAGPDVSAELSRLTLIGVLTFGRELKGVVIAKDGPAPGRWS